MSCLKLFLLSVFGGFLTTAAAHAASYDDLPVKVVLFPFREVVLSARVDGVIAVHQKRNGERFRKGELLLRLDDRHCRNELMKAEAAFLEAKSTAEFSRKVMEDNRKLFRQDMQSELEMRKKELEVTVAESRRTVAEANREEAAMQLDYCSVKAPFEGRVERLFTKEYESVRTGQPLLSILDDDRLLGVMNLPSSLLGTTKPGGKVTIRIKENGQTVSGTIFEIAGRADHRSETFEVKALIDNSGHLLNAGMTGILVDKETAHGK